MLALVVLIFVLKTASSYCSQAALHHGHLIDSKTILPVYVMMLSREVAQVSLKFRATLKRPMCTW